MNAPDSKIAISLGRIASVLIKENIVKDDKSFDEAVSSVAKKYINFDTPKKKTQQRPKIQNFERLFNTASENKEKIERLRKKLYQDKLLEITDKPTINKKSKEIVTIYLVW